MKHVVWLAATSRGRAGARAEKLSLDMRRRPKENACAAHRNARRHFASAMSWHRGAAMGI